MGIHQKDEPHWLYHVYDGLGRLLYIGQTTNPEGRMRNWRNRRNCGAAWFRHARRITWRLYGCWFDAYTAETDAILEEQPPFNVQHRRRPMAQCLAERELFDWPDDIEAA